jgi:gluconokinase
MSAAGSSSDVSHLVLMGVSGAGKSAVGRRVAERLGYVFADADDFHPPGNVARMAHGIPLTDDERAPWLRALATWLAEQQAAARSTVLACSALKRAYRDALRAAAPNLLFVHLAVPREVLLARMRRRTHFMPASLLESQLATLELLAADEPGFTLDAAAGVDAVAAQLVTRLAAFGAPPAPRMG